MPQEAERDRLRERVLQLGRADERVRAGALTGSTAGGPQDRHSDVDVAFGLAPGVDPERVLDEWTGILDAELGVLHHWDLPAGSSLYRVFLLDGGLELDVGLVPADRFGAYGPQFELVFGAAVQLPAPSPPDGRYPIGLAWHHVLHAASAIDRGRPWQAAYWIAAARDQTQALACLRLGLPSLYARGVDRLPAETADAHAASLVRSLEPEELRRALAAALDALLDELRRHDGELADRLEGPLRERTAASAQ
jgi:hypothetical protein